MYGHHRGTKSTCESEAELITLIKVMELKLLNVEKKVENVKTVKNEDKMWTFISASVSFTVFLLTKTSARTVTKKKERETEGFFCVPSILLKVPIFSLVPKDISIENPSIEFPPQLRPAHQGSLIFPI